jgi:replicative superfamily II helicase
MWRMCAVAVCACAARPTTPRLRHITEVRTALPRQAGHSVLIFCGRRVECEWVAKRLANFVRTKQFEIPDRACNASSTTKATRGDIIDELARCGGNPSSPSNTVLRGTMECGVAFHHAGLHADERKLVERAYHSGGCNGWAVGCHRAHVYPLCSR